MKVEFEYKLSDVISIPGRALKAKKIIVASFFLLAALIFYDFFTYLAVLFDGKGIGVLFDQYGLLPITLVDFTGSVSRVAYFTGIAAAIWLLMAGMAGVAIFDFEMMRGNPFFTSLEAIRFSLGRLGQIFLSHFAILIFLALILFLGVIVGLITRIPYLGEWLYAIFLIFPNFIIVLFSVLILFVLSLSILIMPAIIAADRHGETFNSILELFSVTTKQPLRWIGHTIYSLFTSKLGGFIFAYFAYRALQLLLYTTSLGGGEKIGNLFASGLHHLPVDSPLFGFITNIIPDLNFGFYMNFGQGIPQSGLAGHLMAISLFGIFVIIVGYMFSVVATGQAYSYAIIRRIRDGHLITGEKPLKFELGWINPVEGTPGEPKSFDPTRI